MLAKTERLHTVGLKARVIRSGSFQYGTFKMLAGSPPRAAVVVSKKTCPTAPQRNRLRRRIASILREFLRGGTRAQSVIVYPNRSAIAAPHMELRRALAFALRIPAE